MASEQYPFIGALDLDTPVQVFKKGFLSDARNVIFRGGRYENMPGTRSLNLPLPAGINQSIGAVYDTRNHRVFDLNYNSNGNHAIYVTDTLTEVTQTLIANTLLGFDPIFPVSSIDILYGDSIQGDVLYWVNSQGVPSQININQALAGSYGTYRSSYLQVIKEAASVPPEAIYENDLTATINNLRKQLFVFKVQWEFNNRDKSVWSAWSEVPLPLNAADPAVDADPTKNSRIALVLQTGPPNVKRLRIAGAIVKGNVFGDFFEIDLLDKAALSIGDDDVYIYRFSNDKAYIDINIPESILSFDRVPKKAGAGILLNGNVPAYGNITEGFDLLSSLGSSAITGSVETYRRTQPKVLLYAAQTGNSIGTAGDNIHIIVLGAPTQNDLFQVFTTGSTIQYTAGAAPTTTSVINGLSASATGGGFTVVSSDANNLVIRKTAQQLIRYHLTPVYAALGANDTTFVYDWWSRFAYCLTYFDAEGRTNGAQITTGFTVTTSGYAESAGSVETPTISLSIYHQPPAWAYYFHIGRTKNLSKAKILQWVSDRTFKDSVSGSDGQLYAYISIENLNQYIRDKPSAAFLAYDFAPGDRIRFIKLYPTGLFAIPVIEVDKDFEIQQQVLNPIINGVQYQGQFLKIFLPATDVAFNFGIPAHDYSNYFIELYTPALSATENLNLYYEFSERYAIGNPTLSTRFHQGMLQNQSTNYVTPATFLFDQGDYYLRWRSINASPEFKYTLVEQDSISVGAYIAMTLDQTYNAPGYIAKDIIPGYISGNLFGDPNWAIDVTDGKTYTFAIRGSIVVQALNTGAQAFKIILAVNDGVSNQISIDLTPDTMGVANQLYNYTVDTTFTFPVTYQKMYIYMFSNDNNFDLKVVSGNLTINDTARKFTQLVIDPNFSDSFQSAVNSNGRDWTFDINAKETRFPVVMRYGLDYEIDTNINNSNKFYPQNFDTYNNSYGDIMRFYQWGKQLDVYQYRKCGSVGVFARWMKQADGTNQLITSDTIITPNNIFYYNGDYGIGNQVMGLAASGYQRYFPDPVKGYLCRLSIDGVIPISDLYKAQSWAGNNLPTYLNNYPYAYGGYAKVLGVFQFNKDRSGDYICMAQTSQYGLYGIGESLAFNEQDNMFRSKYDFAPDNVICAENKLIFWQAGQMYIADDTAAYGNFFGTHHDAIVQFPLNEPRDVNKSFMAMSYAAPYPQYNITVPKWLAPNMGDVSTAEGQISNLVDEDFDFTNGMYRGALQRNNDSDGGVNDGDQLQGLWLQLRLSNAATQLSWLSNLYINYQLSNRNG